MLPSLVLFPDGQIDGELRPLSYLAFHGKSAAAIGHHPVTDCQSESSSPLGMPSREKWLENPRYMLRRDSLARIRDGQSDGRTVDESTFAHDDRTRKRCTAGGTCSDRQFSTRWHRLFGIDDQVEQQAVQRTRISGDQRNIALQVGLADDPLPR